MTILKNNFKKKLPHDALFHRIACAFDRPTSEFVRVSSTDHVCCSNVSVRMHAICPACFEVVLGWAFGLLLVVLNIRSLFHTCTLQDRFFFSSFFVVVGVTWCRRWIDRDNWRVVPDWGTPSLSGKTSSGPQRPQWARWSCLLRSVRWLQ